jgi:hypothetical protein
VKQPCRGIPAGEHGYQQICLILALLGSKIGNHILHCYANTSWAHFVVFGYVSLHKWIRFLSARRLRILCDMLDCFPGYLNKKNNYI